MEKERDFKIDWIRAICSLTVIIAHVHSPAFVNHIRTFDVVALALISGMSLSLSAPCGYGEYLLKRVKKLLFPTFSLISLVFVLSFLACNVMHVSQLYPPEKMLRSYLLLSNGSMGYVWIVRVYLAIALLAPFVKRIADHLGRLRDFTVCLVLACGIGWSLLCFLHLFSSELAATFFEDYIYTTYVYTLIAMIGYWISRHKDCNGKLLLLMLAVFAAVQLLVIIDGTGFAPNQFKHPPRLYYCVYGVFIGLALYRILPDKKTV